jgi:hypothetical protein
VDEPLQYFFAFNWNSTQAVADIESPFEEETEQDKAPVVSIPTSVKYELFPMGRNHLYIRLENIGDRFDTDRWNFANTSAVFPLDSFAKDLFAKANWNNTKYTLNSISYQELSLTGNQLYTDVNAGKTNWRI